MLPNTHIKENREHHHKVFPFLPSYFCTMSSFSILFSLSFLFLLTHPTFSKPTCKSLQLSTNNTFDNCNDLPTLNAVLHWSYNPSNSTLSMAFTAPPSQPEGWVAWALNPVGTGMAGAQALVAHKPDSSGPITVDTYNITSYHDINKGPISYNVTSISAVESSGAITIFATWALQKDESSSVNYVWQAGPMKDGNIGKHAFDAPNLGSKMKLSLTANGPNSGPTSAPDVSPSASATVAPASGTSAGAKETMVSGVLSLVVASLVCFLGL